MMKKIILNGENMVWAKKVIAVATTLNRSSSKWGKKVQDRSFQIYGVTLQG